MWYVYILISFKDHQLYTGYTENLKTRWIAHEKRYVKATKSRRPLELIYYEAYGNEIDARKREKYLKGGKGRSDLKVQLMETLLEHSYKHLAPSSSG
jgi:putative endonuclease